ncbi:MAG: hypothetical protein QW057_01225 [Candidatus Bathyarchaeia archaeon]
MLRALVIQNDKGRLRDMRDLVNVALCEAQKAFRSHRPIRVLEIRSGQSFNGWIVVVESDSPVGQAESYKEPGVGGRVEDAADANRQGA